MGFDKGKLLDILENTGEVVEAVGKMTGNPYLAIGGKVVQECIQSDDDTADFLKGLSNEELDNLIDAAHREKYRR